MNEKEIGQVVKGVLIVAVLYFWWSYVVMFLVLCGAYHLWLEFKKNNNRHS